MRGILNIQLTYQYYVLFPILTNTSNFSALLLSNFSEREAYRFRADVESQVEKSSHIEASVEESAVSLVASFSETRTWSQSESEESEDENI